MNPNAKINIKDLPQIQQINNGDYLIVESNDGTYVLDYENLILGVENTAITTAVNQNTTDIAIISATVDAQLQSLSSNMYSTFKRVYVGKALVSVTTGNSKTALLSPRPPEDLGEILPDEIIITPANADACTYPAFIASINNNEDQRGLITLTANITKRTYTVSGAVYSSVTINNTGGLTGSSNLSAYTVNQLINGVQVYADPTTQTTPYTVNETVTPTTVEAVGAAPVYYVMVIKPY